MESKTKHRLLGVLVLAGIAVIAYPFIQGSASLPSEKVLVKAPPFPDEAIQVTSVVDEDVAPSEPQQDQYVASPPEVDDAAQQPEKDAGRVTSSMVNAIQPELDVTEAVSTAEAPDIEALTQTDKPSPVVQEAKIEKKKSPTKKQVVSVKAHRSVAKKVHGKHQPAILSRLTNAKEIHANKNKPLDNNGLMQLNKAAWVIQMGSFKHKTNALKLVNKLRAKGYRAFIQRAELASGASTRVFVGPEHQQKSARIVAAELHQKMKLQGIVISYKPFRL
tara:strand:+ start:2016 stop:2843 length:828 start_codon:yes stop_codon:yes gene_type:complete